MSDDASSRGGVVLEPATGVALTLQAGDTLRIVDDEGQQVSDLVVFSMADHFERLSQANTRKLNGTMLLGVSHVLYSTKCRPLLSIVRDDVGRHDVQSSACSPYDYPLRFGVEGHPSCLAILREALAPYGIDEAIIPDPFNVFMHTTVDSETGAIAVNVPLSRPGDSVELRAEMDCLVALTCCPQDMNDCNGGRITPLHCEVIPRGEA